MDDPDHVDFEAAVRAVIGATRPGEVLSYGEVAEEAGHPRGGSRRRVVAVALR